jgi:hypothetical protein
VDSKAFNALDSYILLSVRPVIIGLLRSVNTRIGDEVLYVGREICEAAPLIPN